MTFPIITNIPASGNNPSNDQLPMQQNFSNISGYLNVDHVLQGTTGAGKHLQITLPTQNVPGAQTDPASTVYTNTGTASVVSQLFYKNQNATLQLSAIRAWALVDGTTGNIINSQSVNVSSVVRNSAGNYTVTLTTNAVSSSSFAVLVSSTRTTINTLASSGYTITGTGTFTLRFDYNPLGSGSDVTNFSFQVLQL